MKATVQKESQLEGVTKITVTLRSGHQFEITEGRSGLIVNPGVQCEVRHFYNFAWEIVPLDR